MMLLQNESFKDKDAKKANLFLNLNLREEAVPRKKLILNKLENSNITDLLTPDYANYKLDANTPGSNKLSTPDIETLHQKFILNDVKFISNLTPTDQFKTLDTPTFQFANSNIYKPPINYLSPMNSIPFSPSFENFSNLLSPNDHSIAMINTIDSKANDSTTIDTKVNNSTTIDTTSNNSTTIDTTKDVLNLDDCNVLENKIIEEEECKSNSKIDNLNGKEIDQDKLNNNQIELKKKIDLENSINSQINDNLMNQPINQALNNLSIHSNCNTPNIKNFNLISSPIANSLNTQLPNASNFYHSMNSNYMINQNNFMINNHFNSQLVNNDNRSNLINSSFALTSRNELNSPNKLTNSTNSVDSQILRTKRHSDEMSDEINDSDKSINDKKLKNREAAKRCRERKKQRVEHLESQVQSLIGEKNQLIKQVQYYVDHFRLLSDELNNHLKNGCALNLNLDFNNNNCQNFA